MFGLFIKKNRKRWNWERGKRAGSTASGGERSHVRRGDSRKRRGGKTHGWQDLRAGGWEITLLFDTLHALSMTTDTGAELLLHIGLDTVALKGAHFKAHVKTGDKVRKGDLLLEADLNAIREAGYDVITPMIVCNTDCFAEVKAVTGAEVTPQDTVLILTSK